MSKDRTPRRRPETKPRRGFARRRGIRWRWLLPILPVLIAAGSTYAVMRSPWFTVQEITVRGTTDLDRPELARLSGLQGAHLLALPLDDARARLMAVPRVRDVSFERSWPNGVTIRVDERRPSALWSVGGIDYAIDSEGVVLGGGAPDKPSPRIIETGTDRRLSPGDRVPVEVLTLADRVFREAPSKLNQSVEALEYRASVGLTVVLASGLRATFGDDSSYDYKVAVLVRLLESLSAQGKTARAVDLRFGDRVTYE